MSGAKLTPLRRPQKARPAWIIEADPTATPRLSARLRAELAAHLAEALIRDFAGDSSGSDPLRTNPPGDLSARSRA